MQGLNRQEIEDYVIDLYHNQKKTFREIQKVVRKSPRDIRTILDKVEPERASLSTSSRAYQMFEEGSTPIQVAITLGLREKEVSELYREYWCLNGMYQLNQIYQEIKNDIWSIIELFRRTKSEGLTPQQVSRILKTIITFEYKIRNLEGEQARLEVSNKEAAKTFQKFTDFIQNDHKTLAQNDSIITQREREVENLNMERARLEYIINSIWLNNETCIKVKQIVKQEIQGIISDPRRLLRIALASLFESSRKHPGKFQTLYYNMPSHLSLEQILAQSSICQYEDSEDEKFLLHEAEQSYNRMIDAITNNCINGMQNETEPLYHSPQVLDVNDGLSSVAGDHKIYDTRNLSQVNFVYNNVTFQVCSNSKITKEKNTYNEMDDRLREKESEQRNFQDQ